MDDLESSWLIGKPDSFPKMGRAGRSVGECARMQSVNVWPSSELARGKDPGIEAVGELRLFIWLPGISRAGVPAPHVHCRGDYDCRSRNLRPTSELKPV